MNKLFIYFLILTCASIASAESMSFSIKPSKGLSGTASLNIHDDGKVTLLIYESPTNIVETLIEIDDLQSILETDLPCLALRGYDDMENRDLVTILSDSEIED